MPKRGTRHENKGNITPCLALRRQRPEVRILSGAPRPQAFAAGLWPLSSKASVRHERRLSRGRTTTAWTSTAGTGWQGPAARDGKAGLHRALCSGSVAAVGMVGSLVPPLRAMILFALVSEQPIGRFFVGAMVPAVLAISPHLTTIKLQLCVRPDYAPQVSAIDWRALRAAAVRCSVP
ncbi:MAG: TRAP transporter large permease subunit [Paracoccaceae bacterium]